MQFENIHEIHIFCFLIKKRHFLIKKKTKSVYISHIFSNCNFFEHGCIHICIYIYIYIYICMFLKTGICILYMCV